MRGTVYLWMPRDSLNDNSSLLPPFLGDSDCSSSHKQVSLPVQPFRCPLNCALALTHGDFNSDKSQNTNSCLIISQGLSS